MLFDIIHPQHLLLMAKVAEAWHDQPDVNIRLLRFLQEFCHHRANIVNFDQSSANGILIFQATSDAIYSYGGRLLENPPPATGVTDVYKTRFKGVALGPLCRLSDGFDGTT